MLKSIPYSPKSSPDQSTELRTNSRKSSTEITGYNVDLLKGVVSGISDVNQVLITGKPKNKSKKIRKSNRHSDYRGVSLNGKKWQVMIMGRKKKNYFGGVTSEEKAAKFFDKL